MFCLSINKLQSFFQACLRKIVSFDDLQREDQFSSPRLIQEGNITGKKYPVSNTNGWTILGMDWSSDSKKAL